MDLRPYFGFILHTITYQLIGLYYAHKNTNVQLSWKKMSAPRRTFRKTKQKGQSRMLRNGPSNSDEMVGRE